MTEKNSDMTPDTSELKRKRDRIAGDVRRMRERGELTEDQIAQLDAIGFSWTPKNRAIAGVSDLATLRPDLAAQWHPTKNGELTPQQVTCRNNRKVWWKCENGHEWQAQIASRSAGRGCPYCSKRRMLPGYSDLATLRPDLAAQWHPTKNGSRTPAKTMISDMRKVWWQCEKGHEWEARVNLRVFHNTRCPYCVGKKACAGHNDLATTNPDLAAQWHPDKNGDLTPQQVMAGSSKKVWWQCGNGHEWEARISSRVNGNGCPYCGRQILLPGFNDLATTHPDLASQWHPTKNGELTPQDVMAGSGKKVWWLGECGHEWQNQVCRRSRGSDCPYCAGKTLLPGFNDLATVNPSLAAQWHPTRNGDLTPQELMARSNRKVWWCCEQGHEWEAQICSRSKGNGCPYCSNRKVLTGYNDLATVNPELAAQWHPTKNGDLTPRQVTVGSGRKVWWRCEKGHEWEAEIAKRSKGSRCPVCSRNARKKKDDQR